MRELDGMRIIGPADGEFNESPRSKRRELISTSETGARWSLGEVTAEPDEGVATHIHPGEPEAFIILEGELELHGAQGVAHLAPGDVVFIPPDTEHGLRTPNGGRWLAIWPIGERVPGKRGCYTSGNGLWGTPTPSVDVARERVDNFASGWLAVGAGAVFAFQYGTKVNYPEALMNTDSSIDPLFMSPREYIAWNDVYFDSQRTPGAVSHLDPDPDLGYLRAVTGDLAMTTAQWRSGAGQIVPSPGS